MRGRKNRDKQSGNPSLPPCRVCGEPGCGFHYGVTTCGACKGFFRRCLVRKEPYTCIQSQLCHVGPGISRRQSCPKCRYEKCLAVGMSKEACKVGRYSLIKKSKDMEERMEQHGVASDSNTNDTRSLTPIEESASDDNGADTQLTLSEWAAGSCGATSDNTSMGERPYSQMSNDHDVTNETASMTGAFSSEEEMIWGAESHPESSQMICDGSFGVAYDSPNAGFVFPEYNRKDADEDNHSWNIDMMDVSRGDSVMSKECYASNPFSSNGFVENDHNNVSKPSYAVLGAPRHNDRVSPCLDSIVVPTRRDALQDYSPNFEHDHPIKLSPSSSELVPYINISLSMPHSQQSFASTSPSLKLPNREYYFQNSNDSSPRSFNSPLCETEIPAREPITTCPQSSSLIHMNSINAYENCIPHNNSNGNQADMEDHFKDIFSNKQLITQSLHRGDMIEHSENENSAIQYGSSPGLFDNTIPIPSTESCLNNCYDTITDKSQYHSYNKTTDDDEDDTASKKLNHDQASDSNTKLTPGQSKSDLPVSRRMSEPRPLYVLFLCPELSHYALSVYERFPFVSYEKAVLAPLLKLCHEVKDTAALQHLPLGKSKDQGHTARQICSDSSSELPLVHGGNANITMTCVTSDTTGPDIQRRISGLTYDESEMDSIQNYLIDSHSKYIGNKSYLMTDSDLQAVQDVFWALCQLKDRIHGKMEFMDNEIYYKIFETTGIDVDRRKAWIMTYVDLLEGKLVGAVKFCRAVLGFQGIPLADKTKLTPSSMAACDLLSCHRGINRDKFLFIDAESGLALRYESITRKYPNLIYIHEKTCDFIDDLKDQKLSYEEMVISKAFIITTPGPSDNLEQPDILKECNNTYFKCLLNCVRKRHGEAADERFAKLTRLLCILNGLRGDMDLYRQRMRTIMSGVLKTEVTPLFRETIFYPLSSKRVNNERSKEID